MVQARVITEGFDLYPNGAGGSFGVGAIWINGGGIGMAPGRFGGQSARLSGPIDGFQLFPESDLGVAGFAYAIESSLNTTICRFTSGDGQSQFALCRTNANQMYLTRGYNHDSGTVVAITPDSILIPGTWHYIEVAFKVHDTLGQLRVRLDGVDVVTLNYNGDTRLTGDGSNIGRFYVTSTNFMGHSYDDLYVETGGMAFVGEGRIEVLPVIEDVSNTGFTPSAGSAIYAVMGSVPVVTSYKASALNTGDIFRLKHKLLPSTPETIYGLQVISLSQKDEAGTRKVKNRLWSGATAALGAENALNLNTFTFKEDWFGTDPNTSLAWTRANLNAAQIGVEGPL
jgi:hypothetical protein